MSATATLDWDTANQRLLMLAVAGVGEHLDRHAAGVKAPLGDEPDGAWQAAANAMPALPALDVLCQALALSPFERAILVLCAGMELDARLAAHCAAAHGDPDRPYPTFGLALAALPAAHWSALTPAAPLRRWRLVELTDPSRLTGSPLRIDERILHYLTGIQYLDERLADFIEPCDTAGDLPPSQRTLVDRIAAAWSPRALGFARPVIQLCGDETTGKRIVARTACRALGLGLSVLPANAIPRNRSDLRTLGVLWEREAILTSSALLLDAQDWDYPDVPLAAAVDGLAERIRTPLLLACRERLPLARRPATVLAVSKPAPHEQRQAWRRALGPAADRLNGRVEELVAHFSLSAPAIHAVGVEVLGPEPDGNADALAQVLWERCREQARPRLEALAQRLEPGADWEDLVVPEAQLELLRQMEAQVRQRVTVYERWGFAGRGTRGLGISALFAGPSGAGKTLAAEVLARRLHLDLYRVDLAAVVSKYIGETEKNLRRVFDAAEGGGAILLFDEADALFGKRSEVKDSHDRYANVEVSYLLQRMEAYRGLAILTTNVKSALDAAFVRRIRFVVQFPFPDQAQRAEIWRRIFPPSTPTEGLDVDKLARLNVAGGNIRNIALNAAFLAAGEGAPVQMAHLLRAARSEYLKLEKPLSEAEIGGWV